MEFLFADRLLPDNLIQKTRTGSGANEVPPLRSQLLRSKKMNVYMYQLNFTSH